MGEDRGRERWADEIVWMITWRYVGGSITWADEIEWMIAWTYVSDSNIV